MQQSPQLDSERPQITATIDAPPAFDAPPLWSITEVGQGASNFRLRPAVDGLSARIDAVEGAVDATFSVRVEGFEGNQRHFGSFMGSYDATTLTFTFTTPGPRD